MEIKAIITTWSTKSKTPSRSQFVTDKKHCVAGRLMLWRNNLTSFQCPVVLQVFFLNHNILASTSLTTFRSFCSSVFNRRLSFSKTGTYAFVLSNSCSTRFSLSPLCISIRRFSSSAFAISSNSSYMNLCLSFVRNRSLLYL